MRSERPATASRDLESRLSFPWPERLDPGRLAGERLNPALPGQNGRILAGWPEFGTFPAGFRPRGGQFEGGKRGKDLESRPSNALSLSLSLSGSSSSSLFPAGERMKPDDEI
jgi:hypothetical protein